MAKRTKLEKAELASDKYNSDRGATPRQHYVHGWLDGHQAGTRDSQRRMARKFKQGLRLEFNK